MVIVSSSPIPIEPGWTVVSVPRFRKSGLEQTARNLEATAKALRNIDQFRRSLAAIGQRLSF